MKLKDLTTENCTYYSPEELRRQQWRRGLPLSLIGCVVYGALWLSGRRTRNFYGICPYFEIGKGWGGFAMGWFFVCSKDSSDSVKSHEVGHGLANANVGGFQMVGCSIGSMVRYWWRVIKKPDTPYDSWWFENQATTLGREFLKRTTMEI